MMRRLLRHLFVPHESNNHRAKILHIDSLLIAIALLIFSAALFSSAQNKFPAVLGISYDITPNDLLNDTNQIRQARGLNALRLDPELSQAAASKAAYMFKDNFWAHIAPDGTTPWVFIKNSGYDYLYAGENLARGFSSTSDVVNAWMASPTHRDNMLSSNYSDVGFAVASGTLTGSDTVLVVEMFGTKYKATTEGQASGVVIVPTTFLQPSMIIANPQEVREVASIQNKPLINKSNLTRNIVIGVLVLFIAVLLIDAFVIERKRIIRVLSHNVDHVIYLFIILLIILIMGRGVIL
jgi:hypothetical protein